MSENKFEQQENQYDFPYHFLPVHTPGGFHLSRVLWWGFEYLSYIELIRDLVVAESPRRVLDVGCGNGRLLHEIHKVAPELHRAGVDLSERAISLAKHFTPTGVGFRCVDVADFAKGQEPFDALTMIEVLEHVPIDIIPSFLSSVATAMSPKAKLFLTVPSTNKPLHAKHYQHFDETSLRRTLEPHFHIESIEYLNTRNWFVHRVITPLFCNRLFILNHPSITTRLYRWYVRKCLRSQPSNGQRVFATLTAKT